MDLKNQNFEYILSCADKLPANKREMRILRYTVSLKAMLGGLPEKGDKYDPVIIDNYLWIIGELLSGMYEVLGNED